MNIIFGEAAESVTDNYTKLELDTIKVAGKTFTAYCLIESISLGDFPMLENNITMHGELMKQYRLRNWDFCLSNIKLLKGRWNGEVDSFYNELESRIEKYKQNPPCHGWDGIVEKN